MEEDGDEYNDNDNNVVFQYHCDWNGVMCVFHFIVTETSCSSAATLRCHPAAAVEASLTFYIALGIIIWLPPTCLDVLVFWSKCSFSINRNHKGGIHMTY